MTDDTAVLQLGTGVFLRGFFLWMLREAGFRGRVTVASLTEQGGVERFRRGGGAFHHWVRGWRAGLEVDELGRNGVITEWCDTYREWPRLREIAARPELRIVVTNATEAGPVWRPEAPGGSCPRSFPAKVTALLHARFEALGDTAESALLVLPTELVEGNGRLLRGLTARHAEAWDRGSAFAEWMERRVRFADTLVDRIVAKPSTKDAAEIARRTGGAIDPLAITSEPYHQWVLADDGVTEDLLGLRAAGLHVVSAADVTPWALRKMRLLNGGHACLVFTGLLAGKECVADVLEDELHRTFVTKCLHEEIAPTLGETVEDPHGFVERTLERFANPHLRHRLEDIRLQSHAKVKVRILPSLRDAWHMQQRVPRRLATAFAAFLLVMRDARDAEEDVILDRYRASWAKGGVESVLDDGKLFAPGEVPPYGELRNFVRQQVASLDAHGPARVILELAEED